MSERIPATERFGLGLGSWSGFAARVWGSFRLTIRVRAGLALALGEAPLCMLGYLMEGVCPTTGTTVTACLTLSLTLTLTLTLPPAQVLQHA